MVVKQVIVNKIPNKNIFIDHPQSFARYEQLYLELIENKNKIKQHLVNKDYQPEKNIDIGDFQALPLKSDISINNSNIDSSNNHNFNNDNDDNESILSNESNMSEKSYKTELTEQTNKTDSSKRTNKTDSSKRTNKTESSKQSIEKIEQDFLPNKLQNLLAKKDTSSTSYKEKYSVSRNYFDDYQKSRSRLPTLSELEKQGATSVVKEFADASRLSTAEDEDLKREMLFKFELLKKSYKEQSIPSFTIHSDLNMMKRSYDDTVRRLSLDNSVENYKKYMIGAFMVIEYVLGKFLKFDMKGYTQQQIIQMSSYEKLLVEIGEKSYIPEGKKWPVELRLVFLVIIQTAFFIVGKMIFNNTGSNIMNAINGMNRSNNSTNINEPKKKMQGPSINIDDLPDVNDIPH